MYVTNSQYYTIQCEWLRKYETFVQHLFHGVTRMQSSRKMLNKQSIHACRLTACLHCRHGQDNTVLSCLVLSVSAVWTQLATRQFCLVSTQFPICNCSVSNILIYISENLEIGNWVETRENCLVLCPVVFTPPTRTRQDGLVLSVLAVLLESIYLHIVAACWNVWSLLCVYVDYHKGDFTLYINTGWSSSLSKGGRKLLSQEATLVTAHGN